MKKVSCQNLDGNFPTWPQFAEDEVEAAANVLRSGRSNYWTGEECTLFEKEFADYIGAKYAISMMNCTVALEAALKVLGIGVGDEVIVTCRSFMASASCIITAGGATPVFADIDPESQNMTAKTIEAVLTPKTKAIICVHLSGWPCDMDPIMDLAKKHNLYVIEDCAQAHGAMYKGRHVGTIGHVSAFSFCQDKIITTGGEGGMITTNDHDIWEKIWTLKDHGKGHDTVFTKKHPPGFRWLHDSFGTNYRMTEMQAAIGRVQLRKMDRWIEQRRTNANILNEAFDHIPSVRLTIPPEDIKHTYYRYYIFIKPEQLKSEWSRDRIIDEIKAKGVPCFSGTCAEMYFEKAFKDAGLQPKERLPVAKEVGETCLMFLVYPTINEELIHHVADIAKSVILEASV